MIYFIKALQIYCHNLQHLLKCVKHVICIFQMVNIFQAFWKIWADHFLHNYYTLSAYCSMPFLLLKYLSQVLSLTCQLRHFQLMWRLIQPHCWQKRYWLLLGFLSKYCFTILHFQNLRFFLWALMITTLYIFCSWKWWFICSRLILKPDSL